MTIKYNIAMKNMTVEEYQNAPEKVKDLYLRIEAGWFVTKKMYESTIEEYPEYFPEEVKRKKIMKSIPKEEHEMYYKELTELSEKYRQRIELIQETKYSSDETENFAEQQSRISDENIRRIRDEQTIWNRYYYKYGL